MFSAEEIMLSTLKSMDEAGAVAGPSSWVTSHEPDVRFSGIHREPKPGALQAQGNKRQPQPYIFVKGKRVSTGRTSRFAAK